jgi:hypothetical protein
MAKHRSPLPSRLSDSPPSRLTPAADAQGRSQEEGRNGQAVKAAPPCRTLTRARLDRDADLDPDYAAVATALHYDVDMPADQAITRAIESFRPGETVREWWDRARDAT